MARHRLRILILFNLYVLVSKQKHIDYYRKMTINGHFSI